MSQLFEPVLAGYVGDDGRGSHRLPLGAQCLALADHLVERALCGAGPGSRAGGGATGASTRSGPYFVALFRLTRAYVQEDAAASDRAKEKAQLAATGALLHLLPAPTARPPGHTGAKGAYVPLAVPDVATWQRLQLLLDARVAARLQSYLHTPDNALKTQLFRVASRALAAGLQVRPCLTCLWPCPAPFCAAPYLAHI